MEKLSHVLTPEKWTEFREAETIKALKHMVSSYTQQYILSMAMERKALGFHIHADSYIHVAEKHENSQPLMQRDRDGGHQHKPQASNVSQTETNQIISKPLKETKDTLGNPQQRRGTVPRHPETLSTDLGTKKAEEQNSSLPWETHIQYQWCPVNTLSAM